MCMSRGNDSALIVPSYEACFSPRAAQAAPRAAQAACANGACCSCPGALSFAAGAILAPLYIIDTACLFHHASRAHIGAPGRDRGEARVQRGRGAQPPKEILPRWCFLLTDSVWLGHCISLVGILGVMSAVALVTTTLQALVSDAGGKLCKLRLAGFEALVTPTPFND